MNNIFSPSSEMDDLKFVRVWRERVIMIVALTVTRHDGRHKDAALKVTESDSAPDTQNHHKVIQGRASVPEIGHHGRLSLPRNTLDPVFQAPSWWGVLTSVMPALVGQPGVGGDPAPACCWPCLVCEPPRPSLTLSPVSALWSRPTDTITHALSPASEVNNLNKVTRQHWKGRTAKTVKTLTLSLKEKVRVTQESCLILF